MSSRRTHRRRASARTATVGLAVALGFILASVGTAPTAFAAITTLRQASSSRTGAVTEGIDVSHWQGVIDWTKVREARKRFAYIKASDGTSYVDDRYAANRAGAKAAGLYVGAYHFARPDAAAGDAVAEANHFVDTAAWVRGELLPVLDLEQAGGLSVTALQAWVKAFLGRVEQRTGERGLIYVSPSFWTSRMGDTTWFAEHGYQVLWIAHWTTAETPRMPASDWSSRGWTFWQYTSDGTVPGISGRVDLDRYRGVDFARVRIP
jgi:lysozyme